MNVIWTRAAGHKPCTIAAPAATARPPHTHAFKRPTRLSDTRVRARHQQHVCDARARKRTHTRATLATYTTHTRTHTRAHAPNNALARAACLQTTAPPQANARRTQHAQARAHTHTHTRTAAMSTRDLAAPDAQSSESKTTPVGFEPTRGDPIGLAGRRLNHSAKVSLPCQACAVASHTGYARSCEPGRATRRIAHDGSAQ